MTELDLLTRLMELGGNGAAMAAVYLAWQAYKGLRADLQAVARGLGAVKRAISPLSAQSRDIIDRHEESEEELAKIDAKP